MTKVKTDFGEFEIGEKVWYTVYDAGRFPGVITRSGVKPVGSHRQYCKKHGVSLIVPLVDLDNLTRRHEPADIHLKLKSKWRK